MLAKRNQNGFALIEILVIFITVVLIGTASWYVWRRHQNSSAPSTNSGSVEETQASYKGVLRSVDLSAMAVDGEGIFVVKADDGPEVKVRLASGFSTCDKMAITVPRAEVGDRVEVNGDKKADGSLLVCTAGTFIKASDHDITVTAQPDDSANRTLRENGSKVVIDFATCTADVRSFSTAFGSTTIEVKGKEEQSCRVNYGGEVENPDWDGKLTKSCQVPLALGVKEFEKTTTEVDLSSLDQYC